MLQEHLGLVFWSIPNHPQLFKGQFFISSSVEFDREDHMDQSVSAKKWKAGFYPQLRQQLLFYFRLFFALLMPYMIQSLTWFSYHVLVFEFLFSQERLTRPILCPRDKWTVHTPQYIDSVLRQPRSRPEAVVFIQGGNVPLSLNRHVWNSSLSGGFSILKREIRPDQIAMPRLAKHTGILLF